MLANGSLSGSPGSTIIDFPGGSSLLGLGGTCKPGFTLAARCFAGVVFDNFEVSFA